MCISGFYRINKVCSKCPSDTFYNLLTQECQPKCLQNQVFINGICQCLGGFYMIDGACQPCTYPSTYFNGKCIRCPVNTKYINGNCICASGLYMINGLCTTCSLNEVYNGFICNCIDGYSRNSTGQCVKNLIPTCGMYQYWDAKTGSCQCNSGYVWIAGQCQLINKCDVFSYWNGYQCVCQSGYVFNSTLGRCV